jgi:ABC-type phosphate/phosphonate transport system substrate-binding protein
MADHVPDLAFISISDFLRSVAKGDQHYRGFAIATSKFTGTTNLPSVLVVRQDDPAQSFADLEGARYGYINKSCSSSYFPANIVLAKQGKRLDEYVNIVQVKPWQGQIDAVVAKEVRATMVAEDVWKTTPGNAQHTRIIGRYDNAKPAPIVARQDPNAKAISALVEGLFAGWEATHSCCAERTANHTDDAFNRGTNISSWLVLRDSERFAGYSGIQPAK